MDVRKNIAAGKYSKTDVYISKSLKSFERDLAASLGILKHKKRKVLFELAWEFGRNNGLIEVVHYYETLVELIT